MADRMGGSSVWERRRPMAVVIVVFALLGGLATLVLAAALEFDLVAAGHLGSLFDLGASAVDLLRWGAFLDTVSYIALGVVILYVGERLWPRGRLIAALLTASGVAATLVGAIGAVLLATVGPALLTDYAAASPATREAARVALDALGRGVAAGLWGTLELALLGAWLLGVAWLLRREWPRFAGLAVLSGIGLLASSVRTGLTGRLVVEVAGPVDVVLVLAIAASLVLLFVWLLWLAVTLWRGVGSSR